MPPAAPGMALPAAAADNAAMLDEYLRRLHAALWERRPASPLDRRLTLIGRYCYVMIREALDGQLSMRAMSLVYTTLLSIVPVLALGFSLLKALGAQTALEPMLLNMLAPLGDQADEVVGNVLGFVENMKVGVLGSLGVGLLLIAGLFTRTAAFLGAAMLLSFYLVSPPWPGVPPAPGPEHSLIVNKNLIEVIALLAIGFSASGRWFGLDAVISGVLRRRRTKAPANVRPGKGPIPIQPVS